MPLKSTNESRTLACGPSIARCREQSVRPVVPLEDRARVCWTSGFGMQRGREDHFQPACLPVGGGPEVSAPTSLDDADEARRLGSVIRLSVCSELVRRTEFPMPSSCTALLRLYHILVPPFPVHYIVSADRRPIAFQEQSRPESLGALL